MAALLPCQAVGQLIAVSGRKRELALFPNITPVPSTVVRTAPRPKQSGQSSAVAELTAIVVGKYENRTSFTSRGDRTLVRAARPCSAWLVRLDQLEGRPEGPRFANVLLRS